MYVVERWRCGSCGISGPDTSSPDRNAPLIPGLCWSPGLPVIPATEEPPRGRMMRWFGLEGQAVDGEQSCGEVRRLDPEKEEIQQGSTWCTSRRSAVLVRSFYTSLHPLVADELLYVFNLVIEWIFFPQWISRDRKVELGKCRNLAKIWFR